MAAPIHHSDVLIAVMGAPHRSDMVTSVIRMTQALLERGARVQIWTCGDATGLTSALLGDSKPRNVVDWAQDHPSTAAIVLGLIEDYPDHLDWYVCRFCSEERGMSEQISQVRKRPPFTFWKHTKAAEKTLCLGVC